MDSFLGFFNVNEEEGMKKGCVTQKKKKGGEQRKNSRAHYIEKRIAYIPVVSPYGITNTYFGLRSSSSFI
jgi:hypothetical protein